ncbi:MAG: hypothetical protein QNK11_09980 [Legionella sp.]|nr:hypothetical protein [Legionella sp.]
MTAALLHIHFASVHFGVNSDYTQPVDVVDLTRFWTSQGQVDIHDNFNGDAVIDLSNINNQTITLLGVSSSELNETNVIF